MASYDGTTERDIHEPMSIATNVSPETYLCDMLVSLRVRLFKGDVKDVRKYTIPMNPQCVLAISQISTPLK